MLIDERDFDEVRKKINEVAKGETIIVKAKDDLFNRKVLDKCKFDVLLSVESGKRKGSLRQLDSGFNHVLAKIANKNGIAIGIDLVELKKLDKFEKADRLNKIQQNIRICKKKKVKLFILGNNPFGKSLLFTLGASPKQIINQ